MLIWESSDCISEVLLRILFDDVLWFLSNEVFYKKFHELFDGVVFGFLGIHEL